MFSESVAQKPIMPVSAGKKNAQNCPAFGWPGSNADGCERIGPKPPALVATPTRAAASPSAMSSGALMFSSKRIVVDAAVDDPHVDAPEKQEADELRQR